MELCMRQFKGLTKKAITLVISQHEKVSVLKVWQERQRVICILQGMLSLYLEY